MTIKEIVTMNAKACFDHAIAGVLYYTIETPEVFIQFPVDMNDRADVGTTSFEKEYRPITLMRYIRRAQNTGDLVIYNK